MCEKNGFWMIFVGFWVLKIFSEFLLFIFFFFYFFFKNVCYIIEIAFVGMWEKWFLDDFCRFLSFKNFFRNSCFLFFFFYFFFLENVCYIIEIFVVSEITFPWNSSSTNKASVTFILNDIVFMKKLKPKKKTIFWK